MNAPNPTIVVLDDEKVIADLIKTILKTRGYSVQVATCCAEADRILRGPDRATSLLITDVVMPDMTGPQFVNRLRSEGMKVRVLYISGYADIQDSYTAVELESERLLTKPFAPDDLLDAVEQLLSRSR